MSEISFSKEITENKSAAEVPVQTVGIETLNSSIDVRLRGGYIMSCELSSPSTGERVEILYSEGEINAPKLAATHTMLPAGPFEGLGGQHGFPRWADYHSFPLHDGPKGEKKLALQAKRSDDGLALTKTYELTESAITTETTVMSSASEFDHTSIGEHLYFSLEDEVLDGLKLNGKNIDELLGEGSEDILKSAGTLFWDFGGEATIDFPAGHIIKLTAQFNGETKHPLILWIWKKPGSPSICFEPVVGTVKTGKDERNGVTIPPYSHSTLTTKIELI